MFKHVVFVLMALVAFAAAKPDIVAPLAYTAPLVAAGPATAEYHGNYAARYVAASPYFAGSRYVASPYVSSPYVASPYAAAPYVAAPYVSAPYASAPYVAAPYASAPFVAAPALLKK